MRNVLIPRSASLDRIYATDLYLGSDIQKLAVIDNLCTRPFENITHFKDPVFPPSDMLFDEAPQLSIRTRRRGSRYHADSFDRPADAGGRLMERMVEIGQVVMIARRSSVASVPAWPLVTERGRDTHRLKVGTYKN